MKKLEILHSYRIDKMGKETDYSYNTITKIFSVSKRLIIFICNPENLENCKRARAERGGSKIYYNKEKNTESQKEYRRYKQQLLVKGDIKL